MTWPDVINGSYEILGGFAMLFSVHKLYKDKKRRGAHWIPPVFFTTWGYWNLFYYPALGQTWSFVGAGGVALTNTAYIYLMWKYRKN